MPAGIMKRKYLIVIKIKWYSYDPTFFQNLVFYDQNEYWRNSSSYKVCMLFDVADFTLSLNTDTTYSVLDAYYPNTAIDAIFFFVLRDWSKGQAVIHIPQSHSIGSSPTKKINLSRNVTVKSALGFDLTLRYANNYNDTCTYTWYNPFPCIFYFPKSLVCALIVFH